MNELKNSILSNYQAFYLRHRAFFPAGFFVAGFLFDILTIGRIDDPISILQQGIYLLIITGYVGLELIDREQPLRDSIRLTKLWIYREWIVHFLFGSLLSLYTLFYFKSSSFAASAFFILLLAGVMVANELERFQRAGLYVRTVLLSLCLISYFAYLLPIALGYIGYIPFALALIASLTVIGAMFSILKRVLNHIPDRRFTFAAIAVQVLFSVLYFLQMIPPVPLSAQYMGIYHSIEKNDGQYLASFRRPEWKFWENGAQTFLARPGDRVYVFARIFSPARFKDQIYIRWLFKDPASGWTSSDAIPLSISGGRDEGFRGFAYKQNHLPGKWRVQLETSDGREIGRIGFTIVPDSDSDLERVMSQDIF